MFLLKLRPNNNNKVLAKYIKAVHVNLAAKADQYFGVRKELPIRSRRETQSVLCAEFSQTLVVLARV